MSGVTRSGAHAVESEIQAYLDSNGISYPASRFVTLVSNLYHEAESEHYDSVHAELDDATAAWRRCLKTIAPSLPARVRMLDVGAGTGFASEVVLGVLGSRVDRLTCIDPSEAMLRKARTRLSKRACSTRFVAGDLSAIAGSRGSFDLIVTNSVLHHIPDVEAFLGEIRSLLRPGGIYIAGHEPSREFYESRQLYRWTSLYRRWRRLRRVFSPGAYVRRLTPARRAPAPEDATNAALLKRGVIRQPLPSEVIRQLIDIHVPSADAVRNRWSLQGLSHRDILSKSLPEFACRFATTYSHIKEARVRMGPLFKSIDRWLARRYPMGGSNFLMAAQRPPAAVDAAGQ